MHGPAGVLTVVLYETALGGLALLWLAPLWGVVRPGFFKLAGGTALACAVLAWLAVAAMLINVTSGLTGKYLLQRAQRWLREARTQMREVGAQSEEIDLRLYWDSLVFDLVKQWRKVHLPIALAFAVLAVSHIVAVLLFWSWR